MTKRKHNDNVISSNQRNAHSNYGIPSLISFTNIQWKNHSNISLAEVQIGTTFLESILAVCIWSLQKTSALWSGNTTSRDSVLKKELEIWAMERYMDEKNQGSTAKCPAIEGQRSPPQDHTLTWDPATEVKVWKHWMMWKHLNNGMSGKEPGI